MKLAKFLKQQGQTSIEYLLMLAVSVSMGVAVFKKLNAYLVDNPNSYIRSKLTVYEQMFNPQLKFKKFRLPR